MAVCPRTHHVASSGADSEEDVEEAFRDDDNTTPGVSNVRRSRDRVLIRFLAVDLMVRAHVMHEPRIVGDTSACMCACVDVYVYVYMRVYACVCMYVCMCVCLYACLHACAG